MVAVRAELSEEYNRYYVDGLRMMIIISQLKVTSIQTFCLISSCNNLV